MEYSRKEAYYNKRGKLVVIREMNDLSLLATHAWFRDYSHVVKKMLETNTDLTWVPYAERVLEVRELLKAEAKRRKLRLT